MSPALERETDIKDIFFNKFLRNGEVIIYDKPLKKHSDIAFEHNMGTEVDDGGYLRPNENDTKVQFVSTTETCYIQGDRKEQRMKTIEIAKKILGEDKVTDEKGG